LPSLSEEELQKNLSDKDSNYELIIPTKDTVRYSWLLKNSLTSGHPVFLVGVSGVGKSIITASTIKNLNQKKGYQIISLSFSSQTSAVET
jgi:dynein heavy chain